MWDHTRMAWAIYWIIIGSFVQAQEFSTTVVKEGENAIIQCGVQTKVEEGYMKWETIENGVPVDLAYNLRDGIDCDDRIINCTQYANGSIQLEYVSKEDGARYYRCLRGDADGYNYYSDHRLLVLSKESPSISQSPTSAIAFNAGRKGIVHSYEEQVCEDDVDGNLPLVCYPPSDIIVDRKYDTIQCNCTDSDGLVDSVTFPVTKKTSSPPLFETPHRESVSSYNMGKKGVLHCYNAPVCEDDVDCNIPVVCYPPSGVIVDREYETIQCNCTDSDGLMNSVTFPVTKKTSSPPSIETPHRESVSSYDMGKKGVLHGYNAPVCEDDVDGNLPVVCYPMSGVIVDREYETIQCNCTDTDGLMDSVIFPVTKKTSSRPSIETPHRESVSSYNIGKKGVLHGYNAPVCEDDVDGILPVVCYPPSGVIVDREYGTIQCNCTDSDGLMDNVTFPVTSVTHGYMCTGWRKAFISLLAISILINWVSVLICCYLYKNHKKLKAYRADVELEIREADTTNNTPKPIEIVPVQPSDQTITEASPEQDERLETDEADSGNNRASASPVKPHPVQTSVSVDLEMAVRSNEEEDKQGHSSSDYTGYHTDLLKRKVDEKRVETSFKGATDTDTSHDNSYYDGDSDHEEGDPLLNSNDQKVVLTKPPAVQTVSLKDVSLLEELQTANVANCFVVRPHADNGPKRPCKEYRIDESDGERSFCFQFELKKPGVHLVLSTRREENSPSNYEIYFDEGTIRLSTKGKEGGSFPCGCGKFSMIMEGEELSLSILDEDEGWIPLHTWEEQVYLNQCCSIAVFNMKFLQVEKCRRLTEFENPTSRTLSLHPKRE